MDLYLAFKMRDEPEFNFPWSHEITAALRAQGFSVFNPAEFDEANGFDPHSSTAAPLSTYMEHDLAEVCRAKGLALGKNWRSSVGACLEGMTAAVLGKAIYEVSERRGSNTDPNFLTVILTRLDPAVVMGLCYQKLLPAAVYS